jgi:hypothetical protein
MDRIMEDLIVLLVLLIILLVLGLIWFLIAAAIAAWRYHRYYQQAEADCKQVYAEYGVNMPVDDVIHTVYGAGIDLPSDGASNVGQWVAGSLFGVEEYEERAV